MNSNKNSLLDIDKNSGLNLTTGARAVVRTSLLILIFYKMLLRFITEKASEFLYSVVKLIITFFRSVPVRG
jgi:hypothetical protein